MITAIELVQQVFRNHTDVPVVSLVPMERPSLFVRVDMGPPKRMNPLQDHVRVIVQVYGIDLEDVVQLSQWLHEIALVIEAEHSHAFGWEPDAGPYPFPDPDIPDHRWQFSGTLCMQVF